MSPSHHPASHAKGIRLLIVDDSDLVRRGIKTVISDQEEVPITVVGEAATVAAAVAESAKLKPDVVLMDIRLPDGTGLEACRQIVQKQPEVRVLILTSHSSDTYVYEAIIAGAQGYLLKDINPSGLIQAIADVASGKCILDTEATTRVMRLVRGQSAGGAQGDLAALSAQELRVLSLVATGKTNKEISEALGLSDNTVKHYLGNVFEKLQVKRRSQAAAFFTQNNSTQGK